LSGAEKGTEGECRQEIFGREGLCPGKAYARKVSGAIGSRVTGGVGTGAGSLARAFGATCLRWVVLAAPAERAGSNRKTIASTVSFFMGEPWLEDELAKTTTDGV
jgi:hypothetical protein